MSWHPSLDNLHTLSSLNTSSKPNNIAYYVKSENAWYFLQKNSLETEHSPVVVESDTQTSKWIRFSNVATIYDSPFSPVLNLSRLDELYTANGFSGIDFLLTESKLFYDWDGSWFNDAGFYNSVVKYFERFPFNFVDRYNKSFFIAEDFTPGYSYNFTITNPNANNWLKTGEKLNLWVLSKSDLLMFVWIGLATYDTIFQNAVREKIRAKLTMGVDFIRNIVGENPLPANSYLAVPPDASVIEILKLHSVQHLQVDFSETFQLQFDYDQKIVVIETVFHQTSGNYLDFRAYLPCTFTANSDKTGGSFSVSDDSNSAFDFLNNRELEDFCLNDVSTKLYDPCWDFISVVNLDNHPWQIPLQYHPSHLYF